MWEGFKEVADDSVLCIYSVCILCFAVFEGKCKVLLYFFKFCCISWHSSFSLFTFPVVV